MNEATLARWRTLTRPSGLLPPKMSSDDVLTSHVDFHAVVPPPSVDAGVRFAKTRFRPKKLGPGLSTLVFFQR
jgi:hypothetical protein